MKKKIIFAKIGKEHRFRLSLSLSKDWQYPAKERFREIPNERQIKKRERECCGQENWFPETIFLLGSCH